MSVQSLDRAFDILEFLARAQQPKGLIDISKEVGLHKTTVYRLLNSLKERGYIEKSDTTNLYRLGMGFIELSSVYLNKVELTTEAEPYLKGLSREIGRTVYLAVMQDREVVYIDKYEQFNSLRKYSVIGRRRPLYSTSLGKALLFDRRAEEIRDILNDVPLRRFTENTITDLEELIADIETSKARGFTRDNSEMDRGEQCIGAPIYDYRSVVIAAISVSWKGAFTTFDEDEVAALVKETAQMVSMRLGYLPNAERTRRARVPS
ncbi:MAG: IclR family transcriptional regulator [Spirochaetales bacterium]|nr:IclR family transcriptional regulator [Spirochaetales bacterium]